MDKDALEKLLSEANSAKHKLIRIEDELRTIGAERKANTLSKIIERLESWQNTK